MNEAARGALDEHWQAQLDDNPEARAKLHDVLASFTAWLHA